MQNGCRGYLAELEEKGVLKVGADWRQQQEQEEQRLLEELEAEMTVDERLKLHKELYPTLIERTKRYERNRSAKRAL